MRNDYYKLKGELQDIKLALGNERKIATDEFKNKHRKYLILLDTLIILGVLCNVGAYLTTQYLTVATAETPPVLVESNPVTAVAHDLPTSKEAQFNYLGLITQIIFLAFILGLITYQRWFFLLSYKHLFVYSVAVFWIASVLFFDFANNVSLLFGVLAR